MAETDRDRGSGVMPEFSLVLERPPLDPTKTALVVIDMVNWQVSRHGGMLERMACANIDVSYILDRCDLTVVPNIQRLLAAARVQGVKVIYTRIGSRRSDFSDTVPALREQYSSLGARDGDWACEVVDELKPASGESSLLKTGSSAFASSEIDTELRSAEVEHVIYTGVVTNACVLLTLGAGFDIGYYGYLISDATATFSQRLQETTEEIVGGFMAQVATTDDILSKLK